MNRKQCLGVLLSCFFSTEAHLCQISATMHNDIIMLFVSLYKCIIIFGINVFLLSIYFEYNHCYISVPEVQILAHLATVWVARIAYSCCDRKPYIYVTPLLHNIMVIACSFMKKKLIVVKIFIVVMYIAHFEQWRAFCVLQNKIHETQMINTKCCTEAGIQYMWLIWVT